MHNIQRRQLLSSMAATGLGLALPGAVLAQDGVRTTRVTVGFPAGDMADNLARLISDQIRGKFAETVMVDNKPGAAARLAISSFIKYKGDGSDALFTPGAMVVLFPHVFEKLPYDPLKDLKPVARIANSAFGLALGPGAPAEIKTLEQYLAWTKKDPRNASYATSGAGTGIHLTAEYLARLSKAPLSMVPYRGGSLAANDLVAGQIPAQMATIPSLIEFARAGKVRFIAVSSNERVKALPDVPTFKEQGFAQLVTDDWFAFFLPSSASNDVANALNRSIQTALKDPKVVSTLEGMGLTVAPAATTSDFGNLVAQEFKKWGEIAKSIDFKPLA